MLNAKFSADMRSGWCESCQNFQIQQMPIKMQFGREEHTIGAVLCAKFPWLPWSLKGCWYWSTENSVWDVHLCSYPAR